MEYFLIFLAVCVVNAQYHQPLEFTEVMGQCEDLICNTTSTCEIQNATCLGSLCNRAVCVKIIRKPGTCPTQRTPTIRLDCDGLAEFLPSCYEDNHCTGNQKCCPGRCNFKECQDPVPVRQTIVLSGTPIPTRRPVLVLAGGGQGRSVLIDEAIARSTGPFTKPGYCPDSSSAMLQSLCPFMKARITTCKSDKNCLGDRKCCPGRCGLKECANAVLIANASASGPSNGQVRVNNVQVKIPEATTIVVPLVDQLAPIPNIVISRVNSQKPGLCPPETQNWGILCDFIRAQIKPCLTDQSCLEVKKCCPGRCNLRECKAPLLIRRDSTPAYMPDGPDLVPDRPDPTPPRPNVASCPIVTTTRGSQSQQTNLIDLIVCLIDSNKPTCLNDSKCAGQTKCCRTKCAGLRCQDPIFV